MNRDNWVQSISSLAALLLAILVGAYSIREYMAHRRQQQVTEMERLSDVFDSPRLSHARAAAAKCRTPKDVHDVLMFFEKVARWQEKGLINIDDLDYYFEDPIRCYWFGWEQYVKDLRKKNGENADTGPLYSGFQRIALLLTQRPGVTRPTEAEINNILDFEAKRENITTCNENKARNAP
jgi:hypothetical protein